MIGITRRMDSLGRVVLPKEIRQRLLIKSGDLLDISLHDDNALIIRKSSIFEFNKSYLGNLLKLISKTLNCNIYIINSNKILYSTKKGFVGKNIYEKINITKQETLFNYQLVEGMYLNNHIIKKININGDDYGYIIYEFKDNNTPTEKILNFSFDFLCSCIEM